MDMLRIQDLLSHKYNYSPLPENLSKKYREFYLENLPRFLNISGDKINLYTLRGTLICNGYRRIVIGDYGAFIEFSKTQANKNEFVVEQGQEYRIEDKQYSRHVKYYWYTVNDESNIKIYFQRKIVTYTDYLPNMYYVSPYEIKFGD